VKAGIIYNDFDRPAFEDIAKMANYLIGRCTDLTDFIQNEWHYMEIKDGQKQMIKSEVNRFLERFFKGTEEDYGINSFDISEIEKARGYLRFVHAQYHTLAKSRTPIDIVKAV
jgi:hypothetical protein